MEHYNLPHIGTLGSIHTYVHTYIHAYMHTCIHTCVCVRVCVCTHKYLLICLLERSYPMSLADEQCVWGDVSSFFFGNYRAIGARLSSSVLKSHARMNELINSLINESG